MSAAQETKMRKMILATMTNAILSSCALLQLRYINIVHLLLFCCGFGGNNKSETKAKQNCHVVWQTSYDGGFPHVHMKEQCWLLCPGRLEPVLSVAKRLDIDVRWHEIDPRSS